eukprot:CAMPEP_0172175808 /NCGR_PEP_ID=MMETSP1050-20130122/14442_1 /TAXON_ID=233186 /ORGANISM="Cryptomonas curvata, Strain CCAP979/52" /LENGTH=361 /DNA_ID=CAMNT_0012847969 /DNA_START=568 /DNA_END=1653 /DNA_ORIENTATION=+
MGSSDASCLFNHYYAAHYADCEHEIKEITSGIRLAAVYSLSWTKPTGLPAPPSTEPVNQLLHNLPLVGDVCLGVLLEHKYTRASLSTLGLKALKGVDRNFAGTLLAASAALAQQSPPDELVLHIAKAIRAESSSDGVEARPAVYFRHVFRADGAQRDSKTVDLLNTFDMERHVLNELQRVGPPESTDGAKWWEEYGLEEEPDWAYDWTPKADAGWWHKIPHSSGYTGNQGASYDRVYEIYVVTFWLRSAQARDPQCEAGWEQYSDGGKKFPRINSYVNYVDELCSWYERPSKEEDNQYWLANDCLPACLDTNWKLAAEKTGMLDAIQLAATGHRHHPHLQQGSAAAKGQIVKGWDAMLAEY